MFKKRLFRIIFYIFMINGVLSGCYNIIRVSNFNLYTKITIYVVAIILMCLIIFNKNEVVYNAVFKNKLLVWIVFISACLSLNKLCNYLIIAYSLNSLYQTLIYVILGILTVLGILIVYKKLNEER